MASVNQLLSSVGLSQTFLEIDNSAHYTSIFVHDPIEAQKLAAFETSVAKAHREEVIAKLDLKELQKDEKWVIILTDQAIYKFSPNQPLNQPRKRKPLTEYFDVIADLSNPKQFTTLLYKDSLKTSMKASWQKLVGRTGAKIDINTVLQKREYVCSSELQRDQFVWAFRRVLQYQWQTLLESKVIPAPEIYQQHHLTIKQNKRGANQERLLVISTECLYNVELSHHQPPELDLKWYVPIEALQAVALEENSRLDFFFDRDELDLCLEKQLRAKQKPRKGMLDKSKLTDTYQFSFVDERTRANFVAALSHIYKILHEKQNRLDDLKVLVHSALSAPQQAGASMYSAGMVASPTGTSSGPAVGGNQTGPGALQRKGSMLESLIHQHRQHIQDQQPVLSEPLEKMTHGDVSKTHVKHFALYPDLTIKWGDSASKFKYSAKVISVMKANDIAEQLPKEIRPNFFALRTTEKPLYLIANEAGMAATWRAAVDAYTGATQNAAIDNLPRNSSAISTEYTTEHRKQAEVVKLQLTVPVINGYLGKFTKGGKSEHSRYFALHADGTIHWGDSPNKLKYSAIVIDIDQDISTFTNHELPHSVAMRFIRIKTTDKTLELVCPTQESADRWSLVCNKVLNPEYEDDMLLDDDDHHEDHDNNDD